MKEIYIVHQYYETSHFKALYDCEDSNNYKIKKFIILDKVAIIKKCLKRIIREKDILKSMVELYNDFLNILRFKKIKNKTLIVGLAPYDKLLNKYAKTFKNNNSIYFTSWQFWDGSNFPRGNINNKEKFEDILKNNFIAAACVSSLTEKYMKEFFVKTKVVNHSIDIDKYERKTGYDKIKKFLFLGSLNYRKNIPLLIEWNKNNSNKEYEFYFAGDGELKKEIIELASENSNVKYLGKLSKKEIQTSLKDYSFLVLPSKEEPFGIVILEALAAGIPCIVSNALGPKEIISDGYNGYIFDMQNSKSFYEVMEKVDNISEKEYKILSNNAIQSSKKYDTKNIINNWLELIL